MWVKLSDTFAEDPRFEQTGPLAMALHVAALCYCSRQMTDGLVPQAVARRLLELADADQVVASLVTVGRWEATDDGYLIVDYLDDQFSREQIEGRRKTAAEKKSRQRRNGVGQFDVSPLVSPLVSSRDTPRESPPSQDPSPKSQDPTTTMARESRDSDDGGALTEVVVVGLPGDIGTALTRPTVAVQTRRLAGLGWTPDVLRRALEGRSWNNAGPGAVIAWLRGLEEPPQPKRSTPNPKCETHGTRVNNAGVCPSCRADQIAQVSA